MGPVGFVGRILIIIGAAGLMIPVSSLSGAWAYNTAGFLLSAVVLTVISLTSRSEMKQLPR
jgi:membrane protein implicated in regulation of membrane protease activity